MQEHSFTLFADYHQFYLRDDTTADTDGANWNDAALKERVFVAADGFAVSTARNMEVPVQVLIAEQEPPLDMGTWDHAVSFSIAALSGRLIIAGCTDYLPDAARLTVPEGPLRVRVLFAGLETLSEDGLDGDDHYRIELWPGTPLEFAVLKSHPSS